MFRGCCRTSPPCLSFSQVLKTIIGEGHSIPAATMTALKPAIARIDAAIKSATRKTCQVEQPSAPPTPAEEPLPPPAEELPLPPAEEEPPPPTAEEPPPPPAEEPPSADPAQEDGAD